MPCGTRIAARTTPATMSGRSHGRWYVRAARTPGTHRPVPAPPSSPRPRTSQGGPVPALRRACNLQCRTEVDGDHRGGGSEAPMSAEPGDLPAGARLLAVVSLLAGAGFVVAVAVFLARNGWYVLLGLAGVVVSIVGGWWMATGRAGRRLAGRVAVVVGVAGLVAAILAAGHEDRASVVRAVVSVALLAVAVVPGRAALATGLRASVSSAGHRVPPPQHAVLLCNP